MTAGPDNSTSHSASHTLAPARVISIFQIIGLVRSMRRPKPKAAVA